MKKSGVFIISILLLIIFDQGAKLIINSFIVTDSEELLKVAHPHIHTILNDETAVELRSVSESIGLPYSLMIVWHFIKSCFAVAAMFACLYASYRVFSAFEVRYPNVFINTTLCLSSAVPLGRLLDIVLRGGTLDFICFPSPTTVNMLHCAECGNSVEVTTLLHRSFDLIDVYFFTTSILISVSFLYMVLFGMFNYIRVDKNTRKIYDENLINSFRRKAKQ